MKQLITYPKIKQNKMSETVNTYRKTSNLFQQFKSFIFKNKFHLIFVIVLPIFLSGFQGKVVSLKNQSVEMHQEIFALQMKKFFEKPEQFENNNLVNLRAIALVEDLYKRNGYRPIWTINYTINNAGNEYIELLENAKNYGLDQQKFNIGSLFKLTENLKNDKNYLNLSKNRMAIEINLTESVLRYMASLDKGIVFERSLTYNSSDAYSNLLEHKLVQASVNNNLIETIKDFQPTSLQYVRLQKALERYIVEVDFINHENTQNVSTDSLAKKILLNLSYAEEIKSDKDLSWNITEFQKDYNLEQNGKLNNETVQQLKLVASEKYKTIALNLERLRQDEWKSNNYILVNIPSYFLKVVENNKEVASYRTVIGKPVSPTPEFSAEIETIVTNPSWIVPKSISSNEILYRIKKDTTYLERNKYVVFDTDNNPVDPKSVDWNTINASNFNYRIIQKSSEGNALGKIKFLFPNKYSVYVHDTQSKRLFNNTYRAYSHGCVRLENPHILASYIIKKQGQPFLENKLHKNLSKGVQEVFRLENRIEIHLRYYTVEADDNGNIQFYDDIYKKDQKLKKALFS